MYVHIFYSHESIRFSASCNNDHEVGLHLHLDLLSANNLTAIIFKKLVTFST